MMNRFLKIGGILFLAPQLGLAFEITLHDQGPMANQDIQSKKVETVFPLATSKDVVCGKSNHMTRFQLNERHAGLPFSISAKKKTRIKISWDNPKQVMSALGEKKTLVFPHAGSVSRLYFRAYEPVSGNVYVMNDNDDVIKTCTYSFLPVKRYRQSINVDVNETEYDYLNSTLEEENNNLSINYRISSRTAVPDGASWSLSAGVSQSDSSVNSQRVSSSFSFNW